MRYADDEATVAKILAACRRAGVCGLDTETYGHDISVSTAPHRATIHVWSLAVLTGERHPRGHRVASGFTLSRRALDWAADFLADPGVLKIGWNLPHDLHAIENTGLALRGGRDGLPRCRVHCPHLPRHGLKTVGPALVGRTLSKYEDVVTQDVTEYVDGRGCICQGAVEGAVWDRPRCPSQGRNKAHRSIPVLRPIVRRREQPLESIVPGHPLWTGLGAYAAEDAVTALECWDWMDQNPADNPPDPGWSPLVVTH